MSIERIFTLITVAIAKGSYPLTLVEMPKYQREIRPREEGDTLSIQLDKRGYRRYKRRYNVRGSPAPIDTIAVKSALNKCFDKLEVVSVTDLGEYLEVQIKEI